METKNFNITALRNELIDTFLKLKAKEIGIQEATTAANVAGKQVMTAKVQLEYNRHVGSKEPIEFLQGN